jgi:type VI protein secretion system component Hcp
MAHEMFMKFVVGGNAIDAEAQAKFDTNDDLMSDFKLGKFCAIEDFDLGMGLQDEGSGNEEGGKSSKHDREKLLAMLNAGNAVSAEDKAKAQAQLEAMLARQSGPRYVGWLDGTRQGGYEVDFEPFSFSKRLDKVSPLLFQMSCNRDSFASVTLVKRKLIGATNTAKSGATASQVSSQAYLRFDFTDVLVIGLDWDADDEEEMKEKCKFIARGVTVQYRPQMPDGTLGDIIPGQWQRAAQKPKR